MSEKKHAFLPDLGNEISGEQLVFEQKLFRANEAFIRVNQEIIAWFQSPELSKSYPKSCLNNKNSWQRQMKIYAYNRENGILYKAIKHSDEIGEYVD